MRSDSFNVVLLATTNVVISSGNALTYKMLLRLANVSWEQADILPCWSAKHGWEAVLVASDLIEAVEPIMCGDGRRQSSDVAISKKK